METKVTFENICEANKLIKTTNIKGKEYAEVPQRVKAFRSVHPNGSIETEIYSIDAQQVIIKATIKDENGAVLATDYSQEYVGKTNINTTSFLENCSTSAVGRALGFAGFGSDISIASADELKHAIEMQKEMVDDVVAKIEQIATEAELNAICATLNDAQKQNPRIIEAGRKQRAKIKNAAI